MIIYTVGTFDLLHVGHLALLKHCKEIGNTLVVGVASDALVNSYKLNFPIISLSQRMEMLEALECVDSVHSYDDLEYVSACKRLDIDVFVVGGDWGDRPHNLAVEKFLKSTGKKLVKITYDSRNSSSQIKQDVLDQFSKK